MRLRLKFFLILIAFALVPVLSVVIISQQLASEIGDGRLICLERLSPDQWYSIGILTLLVLVAAALAAVTIVRAGTENITEMVDAWHRLAAGDYSVRIKARFKDERDILHNAFNEAVCRFEEHFNMSTALELAQEVQRSLLPRSIPDFPGFDVAAASRYCDETGGDYYDLFTTESDRDGRLAVVVGDVSGHGVSAALLMATARAFLNYRVSEGGSPSEIVTDVNVHLSRDTRHTGQFMTLFFADLEKTTGEIRWVRAGHDPALVYDPKSNQFTELVGQGMALGLDDNVPYVENSRYLQPGQLIVIGTDGIWEAKNDAGEMFGKNRLKAIIRGNGNASAESILDAVTEALGTFRGNRPFEDDVTMAVVRYTDPTEA